MSTLEFSVVIPTCNRPAILQKTLDCLEAQDCDFQFEVIVIDDYPENVLPDLGFGMGRRVSWRLIRNESNRGRAATRNRGIMAAVGQHLLFIDDDIWAEPQLLRAHHAGQRRIGGGIVAGAVPVHPEIPHDPVNEHYRKRMIRIQQEMLDNANDLPFNYFFTGNVSVPREEIIRAGMFDESFRNYSCEDTEMGYRLKKNGVRFVYEPKAVGWHFNNETLDQYLAKWMSWGRSAYNLSRLHPELSEDISVAGLLFPGRSRYQALLNWPMMTASRLACHFQLKFGFRPAALDLLDRACMLHYAYGMKCELAKDKSHQ